MVSHPTADLRVDSQKTPRSWHRGRRLPTLALKNLSKLGEDDGDDVSGGGGVESDQGVGGIGSPHDADCTHSLCVSTFTL